MSRTAAVPAYVGTSFDTAPPGHRFGLYFTLWDGGGWVRAGDDAKLKALANVCRYPQGAVTLTEQLRDRQTTVAATLGEHCISLAVRATAPYMTGIGMEHPLENGFAFLNPYGLPYLPGSSIKGVLRGAAEELALGLWGETGGWDMLAVWRLFGLETTSSYLTGPAGDAPDILRDIGEERRKAYLDWVEGEGWDREEAVGLIKLLLTAGKERDHWLGYPGGFLRALTGAEVGGEKLGTNNLHLKGALSFWDAIVVPPDGHLEIDILNPHHGAYYQNGTPPNDAESPIPNYFLTVPPGAAFHFHVALCEPTFLSGHLATAWRDLVEAAFSHAFDWLGFGAKTAVGYGQMERDQKAEEDAATEAEERAQEAARAAMTPGQKALEDLGRLFAQEEKAGNKDAGGPLAQGVKRLLDEAEEWPVAECAALCDLADLIIAFLDLSKKKKKERQARIQALRSRP